ncbi:hypothetical protein BC830DRAFT_1147373 [Chytriomyces sp. MP71]|nr:hypothetical protein BC830DRAFT_1147373 [Chytriomyces sp. MP71]
MEPEYIQGTAVSLSPGANLQDGCLSQFQYAAGAATFTGSDSSCGAADFFSRISRYFNVPNSSFSFKPVSATQIQILVNQVASKASIRKGWFARDDKEDSLGSEWTRSHASIHGLKAVAFKPHKAVKAHGVGKFLSHKNAAGAGSTSVAWIFTFDLTTTTTTTSTTTTTTTTTTSEAPKYTLYDVIKGVVQPLPGADPQSDKCITQLSVDASSGSPVFAPPADARCGNDHSVEGQLGHDFNLQDPLVKLNQQYFVYNNSYVIEIQSLDHKKRDTVSSDRDSWRFIYGGIQPGPSPVPPVPSPEPPVPSLAPSPVPVPSPASSPDPVPSPAPTQDPVPPPFTGQPKVTSTRVNLFSNGFQMGVGSVAVVLPLLLLL